MNWHIRLFLRSITLVSIFIFYPQFATASPVTIEVLDPSGNPAEGMAVYLNWLDGESLPSSTPHAIDITQKDKGFSPYMSVVQAGTPVFFSNSDDITHHIYSISGKERFSHVVRKNKKTKDMMLDHPGSIAMGCNIHDWMSGHLLVVNTPYFAITNSNGRVVIDVDTAGNYKLVTWHPQMNEELTQSIQLPKSDTIVLKLKQQLSPIPKQKGVDDFDFLKDY